MLLKLRLTGSLDRLAPMKTGILLINLGTPDAATVPAVRRYLREFLSDPYVIDIPAVARWILLNGVILPFRTKQSTEAYQQIWTEQGSPLLLNSKALSEKLANSLGENYCVELAMRYGKPSIETAVKKLLSQDIDKIMVVPLYPQYAESTTESSIVKATRCIQKRNKTIPIITIREFFQNLHYIDVKAALVKQHLAEQNVDKVIFSYHGLPERHIKKTCHEQHCDLKAACPPMSLDNKNCYRAQCYATSRRIAEQLDLNDNDYLVTFQSRLGKTPWITPYTDLELDRLAKEGHKNIAIVCPSFVADCLETLEEIDIRAKQQWQELGGKNFIRIPCLNDHPNWINGLANIIKE